MTCGMYEWFLLVGTCGMYVEYLCIALLNYVLDRLFWALVVYLKIWYGLQNIVDGLNVVMNVLDWFLICIKLVLQNFQLQRCICFLQMQHLPSYTVEYGVAFPDNGVAFPDNGVALRNIVVLHQVQY